MIEGTSEYDNNLKMFHTDIEHFSITPYTKKPKMTYFCCIKQLISERDE